ncbi:MAG: hypothetical protein AABZ47_17815, partial [Planctomycetota bacterium]
TWDGVRKDLDEALENMASFAFHQPPAAKWWSTVSGKMETGVKLSEDAAGRLIERLPSDAIDRIEKSLEAALTQQSAIAGSLEDQLQTVQDRFAHLKERAASLGKPFELISLDLKTTAAHFPLLAGLGCAAGLAWLGYWRGRLQRAATWMRFDDSDAQSLSPLPFLDGGRRTSYTSEFLLGVIGIGWVGVAAFQLSRAAGHFPDGTELAEVAIGLTAIILALFYRVRTNVGAPMPPFTKK